MSSTLTLNNSINVNGDTFTPMNPTASDIMDAMSTNDNSVVALLVRYAGLTTLELFKESSPGNWVGIQVKLPLVLVGDEVLNVIASNDSGSFFVVGRRTDETRIAYLCRMSTYNTVLVLPVFLSINLGGNYPNLGYVNSIGNALYTFTYEFEFGNLKGDDYGKVARYKEVNEGFVFDGYVDIEIDDPSSLSFVTNSSGTVMLTDGGGEGEGDEVKEFIIG